MSFVHQLFADDDRVLEVVALVRHERDEHVAAQGQVALEGRGAVGDDVALLDLVADLDDRLLVLAGPLVEADELPQLVHLGADLDAVGVDVGDRALVAGPHEHARVAAPRRAPGPCRRSAARPTAAARLAAACWNPSARGSRRRARGTESARPTRRSSGSAPRRCTGSSRSARARSRCGTGPPPCRPESRCSSPARRPRRRRLPTPRRPAATRPRRSACRSSPCGTA